MNNLSVNNKKMVYRRRNDTSIGLDLYIFEDETWKHYMTCKHKQPDNKFNTNGFATSQFYMRHLGYTFLQGVQDAN